MHGLQTLQAINNATTAFRRERAKTRVSDVIEGFFVFNPNGYELVYHTQDKLPEDDTVACSIEFKGEDSRGARFDVKLGDGPKQMNRTLDEVINLASSIGIDRDDVAGRLGRQFATIKHN